MRTEWVLREHAEWELQARVHIGICTCIITLLLMCQPTDTAQKNPNKKSAHLFVAFEGDCVCHLPGASAMPCLQLLEQSADSTRPGHIDSPQPLLCLAGEGLGVFVTLEDKCSSRAARV